MHAGRQNPITADLHNVKHSGFPQRTTTLSAAACFLSKVFTVTNDQMSSSSAPQPMTADEELMFDKHSQSLG